MTELSLHVPLAMLSGWWLQCRCDCGRSVTMPCALLAKRVGGTRTLYHILPRIRCETCSGVFSSIVGTDTPSSGTAGRIGAPDGVRIILR